MPRRDASAQGGPLWAVMDGMPRVPMGELRKADLPEEPGVYALYRDGRAVYVGLAERQTLQGRIWKNHRGRGVSMTGSAMRRNVAERLGIASSADIKARRYQPTVEDAAKVVAWLDDCEIAWQRAASQAEAAQLERDLKREWMPPLTKR